MNNINIQYYTTRLLLIVVALSIGCTNDSYLDPTITQYDIIKHYRADGDIKANYKFTALTQYNGEIYAFGIDSTRENQVFHFDMFKKDWVSKFDTPISTAITAFTNVSNCFSGGFESNGDTLFMTGPTEATISGSNMVTGEKYFSLDVKNVPNRFGSEVFAALAYQNSIFYVVYHSLDYDSPVEETERILAINKDGEILFSYPTYTDIVNYRLERNDYIHGLTVGKSYLWHARTGRIMKMDLQTGEIIEVYEGFIPVRRPSGILATENSLWVLGFYGDLYQYTFSYQEEE